ncbi:MAG: AtpZ/AtpI family protein [Candidatus Moranbacteria bacterium]|nr:AtpZ/AtpI family protein [Candidatus Moranbacteria bacterium]
MSKKSDRPFSALSLAWEMGYTIAVPIVVFALSGRYADKKLETSPWFLLGGILLSTLLSSWLIWKKTLDIIGK